MKRIIILGAGISGLSLAWFLKRRFGPHISLQILEKDSCPGGWIRTIRHEGFLFEQGPRSCRSSGTGVETLKLIEQLSLEDEVITADPLSHARYLFTNNKLRKLPSGILSFLLSPLTKGAISGCLCDLITPAGNFHDESIYSFIKRRFNRQIAEQLMDPLVSGIYAGNIKKLSMKSCFPSWFEKEKTARSVLKGMIFSKKSRPQALSSFVRKIQEVPIFSFKNGMGSLIEELSFRLDRHIIYSSEVKTIHSHPQGIGVKLENGLAFEADHLYSAIPASSLGQLFKNSHSELSEMLLDIPHTSIATVHLGYHRKVFKKKGFGYLIPSREKEEILGTVWDSSVFPQQNQIPEETRFTVMIGGAHMSNFSDYSKQDFYDMAIRAISRHLGISNLPNAAFINLANQAIPQYLVGHTEKISAIETILARIFPKLTLHGNSFHGISVNDCIAASKKLEEESGKTYAFAKKSQAL